MNLTEAMEFIHAASWRGSCLGLERITELMARLGDPQRELRFIHVAGTNGKGSVCAMLASVLTRAGYRTGLYTSPHLFRVNERIKVDGADVSDAELTELAALVKPAADSMADPPTEFERITAMALLYFARRRCGAVVLEVGLGGRLDSTNVIGPPEAAVVTDLSLEHTAVLGDTLEQIAGEKAGIIKPGASVVLSAQSAEAENVIRRRCAELGCPLFPISAAAHQGVDQLMNKVSEMLSILPPIAVYEPEYVPKPPVIDYSQPLDVQRLDDGTWVVDGPWLQRLMSSVNLNDYESRMYFDKTLRESGLYQRLEEMGIQDGDTVSLYDFEFEYQR